MGTGITLSIFCLIVDDKDVIPFNPFLGNVLSELSYDSELNVTVDMPCWPRPVCEVLNAVHNVVNCRESEYGLWAKLNSLHFIEHLLLTR